MATPPTSEWTEEKCIQLIREYKKRPVLWNTKDPFFFKKSLKPAKWQEISEIMGVPPDKCRHKMVILMSSFRREKSKIAHSMKDGKDASKFYASTWFAFKELSFLMDRRRETKEPVLLPDNVAWNSETILNHYIDPLNLPPTKRPKTTDPKNVVDLDTETTQEGQQRVTPSCAPRRVPDEDCNDEIASFTSFIMNKMKKYSETTKNAVQQAICDIIFKADQNLFETNNYYETFNIIDMEPDPLDKELYSVQNDKIKEQVYTDDSD